MSVVPSSSHRRTLPASSPISLPTPLTADHRCLSLYFAISASHLRALSQRRRPPPISDLSPYAADHRSPPTKVDYYDDMLRLQDISTLLSVFQVVPCAVLALLNHPSTSHHIINRIFWAFVVYLEIVPVLPQLRVMQNTKIVEPFTTHYAFALGIARFLSCARWVLQVVDLHRALHCNGVHKGLKSTFGINKCSNCRTLCSGYKPGVHNQCLTCNHELGNMRCLALEKVAASLELPCNIRPSGAWASTCITAS